MVEVSALYAGIDVINGLLQEGSPLASIAINPTVSWNHKQHILSPWLWPVPPVNPAQICAAESILPADSMAVPYSAILLSMIIKSMVISYVV